MRVRFVLGATLVTTVACGAHGGSGGRYGVFGALPEEYGRSNQGITATASFMAVDPSLPDGMGCPSVAAAMQVKAVRPLRPGRVTVSVGPLVDVPLEARAGSADFFFTSRAGSYGPGAPITYRARGGEVPDVDVTVNAPPPLQWLEPACREARPPRCPPGRREGCPRRCGPALDRRRDLTVRWVPFTGGVVRVWVYPGAEAIAVTLPCVFDARAGSGIIPSRMLQLPDPDLVVQMEPVGRNVVERGGVQLRADASGPRTELAFGD